MLATCTTFVGRLVSPRMLPLLLPPLLRARSKPPLSTSSASSREDNARRRRLLSRNILKSHRKRGGKMTRFNRHKTTWKERARERERERERETRKKRPVSKGEGTRVPRFLRRVGGRRRRRREEAGRREDDGRKRAQRPTRWRNDRTGPTPISSSSTAPTWKWSIGSTRR